MTAASALRLGAQLLTVPLLSHYMTPHEYGIVALAMPIISLSMALGDAGLCTSLVRHRTFDAGTWSSAFWLLLAFGTANVALMFLLSPVLIHFYGDPDVSKAFLALSAALFLQALTNIASADLQRAGRFQILAAIEIGATIAGIATAIILATRGFGFWSLVGQQIAFWIIRSTMTWTYSQIRPTAHFEIAEILPHLKYGYRVLQTAAVALLNRSIDTILVGVALGPREAGLYAMAIQFMRLPTLLLVGPLLSIIIAVAARIQDDKPQIRNLFLAMTSVLASFVFPPMLVAAVAHRTLFKLLLAPKWQEASVFFGLMAPAGAMIAVTILSYPFLQAIGRPEVQLRASVENSLIWIVCIGIALQISLTAVAATLAISFMIYFPRFCAIVLPQLGCTTSSYIRAFTLPLAVSAAIAFFYLLVQSYVATRPIWDWTVIISLVTVGTGTAILTSLKSLGIIIEVNNAMLERKDPPTDQH